MNTVSCVDLSSYMLIYMPKTLNLWSSVDAGPATRFDKTLLLWCLLTGSTIVVLMFGKNTKKLWKCRPAVSRRKSWGIILITALSYWSWKGEVRSVLLCSFHWHLVSHTGFCAQFPRYLTATPFHSLSQQHPLSDTAVFFFFWMFAKKAESTGKKFFAWRLESGNLIYKLHKLTST